MRALGSLAVVGAALVLAAAAAASFPGEGEVGLLMFTQPTCPSGRFGCSFPANACAIDAGERVPRRLQAPAGSRVSADGTRVAYGASDGIYAANADGSGARRVLAGALGPSWSPDGKRLAVLLPHVTGSSILTVGVDGSAPTFVASGGNGFFSASNPAWSPDGRRIAFVREHDLVLYDPDGTHGRFLSTASNSAPDWSPDGTRIAFVRERQETGLPEIWTIDSEGRDPRFVAVGRRPAWSPNGREIAYENDTSLWVAEAAGGNARVRYEVPGFASVDPQWLTARQLRALPTSGTCLHELGGGYEAGTEGPDAVVVTGEGVQLEMLGGDDLVWVARSADPQTLVSEIRIEAGDGADRFVLEGGRNIVFGGPGDDVVTTSSRIGQRVSLGDGNDYALTWSGDDVLYGGAGNDRLFAGTGRDRVFGGLGDDRIEAWGAGAKTMDGGSGDDRISGGYGPDRLIGGPDRDEVDGKKGADRISIRDGAADVTHCRGGIDVVVADRRDEVEGRCRRVERR
jgi:dipeptidyl aminopeptidase/acylaminoacyl peptidase